MSTRDWLFVPAFVFTLAACGSGESSAIDAGMADATPDATPDAMEPDAAVPLGAMYSGVVNAGSGPLSQATIELSYGDETFIVTTDAVGEFSTRLPLPDTEYEVYIPGPDGFWSHSSWMLNLSAEEPNEFIYDLATDSFIDGLSAVLGKPAMDKSGGVVSLDILVGGLDRQGLALSIGTPADPVFSFTGGMPIRTPTLLGVGDTVLIFGNVAPQRLEPAVPNMVATGCRQLAPASNVRAGSILTLTISCL